MNKYYVIVEDSIKKYGRGEIEAESREEAQAKAVREYRRGLLELAAGQVADVRCVECVEIISEVPLTLVRR